VLCIGVIYTLYFFCPLLFYIDVVLLFNACCGYLFLSVTHPLVLPVPLLFVCETSWLVTCPCFYVCPVFCLQPRKCAICQVCSDTTLRQSHFNGNMDDQNRQKKFTIKLLVEKPKSNIWPKILRLLLTPHVFTKSDTQVNNLTQVLEPFLFKKNSSIIFQSTPRFSKWCLRCGWWWR
jgi:hypothetical protein